MLVTAYGLCHLRSLLFAQLLVHMMDIIMDDILLDCVSVLGLLILARVRVRYVINNHILMIYHF